MPLSPATSVKSGYPLGLTGAVSATRYVGGTASVAPTTGTFAVGDFVITQDGKVYVCTTAGTPGTWTQVGASGGGLIGLTVYAPAAQTILSTTSTTLADVDAANAAVTFTAPASGNVLVRVSCWVDEATGTNDGGFLGLREASSNLSGTVTRVTRVLTQQYLSVPMYVAGISAGAHTYKLAFSSAGDLFRLIVQDGTVAVTKWGPLIIEVLAAP